MQGRICHVSWEQHTPSSNITQQNHVLGNLAIHANTPIHNQATRISPTLIYKCKHALYTDVTKISAPPSMHRLRLRHLDCQGFAAPNQADPRDGTPTPRPAGRAQLCVYVSK